MRTRLAAMRRAIEVIACVLEVVSVSYIDCEGISLLPFTAVYVRDTVSCVVGTGLRPLVRCS